MSENVVGDRLTIVKRPPSASLIDRRRADRLLTWVGWSGQRRQRHHRQGWEIELHGLALPVAPGA